MEPASQCSPAQMFMHWPHAFCGSRSAQPYQNAGTEEKLGIKKMVSKLFVDSSEEDFGQKSTFFGMSTHKFRGGHVLFLEGHTFG